MNSLYLIQVTICICFMDGFYGQPLYEDKCHVDEMYRRFNDTYNRDVLLLTQVDNLKNQVDFFRETVELLQFHFRCSNERRTYSSTDFQSRLAAAPYAEKVTLGGLEEDCTRSSSGYDYTGKVYVTQSGRTCQAWNSQNPHSHKFPFLPKNYCRNPDGEPAPWCYTTDPDKRWEICNIPYCGLAEEECKRSRSGYDYTGNVSVTQSGRTCQAWNSQTPHSHKLTSLQENYCRNPDGQLAPWCYTTDPDKRWEICNIPFCVTCPLECLRKNDPKGKKYFGTLTVTKTGDPCQRWDSQTPHKHIFDELADQENYCRNPDEGDGPWCYTTNATKRYDYCSVPHC